MPVLPKYPYVTPKVNRSVPYSQRTSVKDSTITTYKAQSAVRFTWDREGSLMTTCEIGYPKLNLTLNIYPCVLKVGGLQLGIFAHLNREYPSTIGLTMSWMPIMPGFRFNIK